MVVSVTMEYLVVSKAVRFNEDYRPCAAKEVVFTRALTHNINVTSPMSVGRYLALDYQRSWRDFRKA